MKFLANNPNFRSAIAAIALGLLSVGIVNLATMTHEGMMKAGCPIAEARKDCADPIENNVCLDYHLGVIQNLFKSVPNNTIINLFAYLLVAVLLLASVGLIKKFQLYYTRQRIRFRQLFEKTITVFQEQLGFWLATIQKKDPSFAFALA